MMTSPARALVEAVRPGGSLRGFRTASPSARAATLALAERERVLPALGAVAIADHIASPVPASLIEFFRRSAEWPDDPMVALAVELELNRERLDDFSRQLSAVSAVLDGAGISWIPLKGAAFLLDEVWPDPATRTMTDLDLLVEDPDRLSEAAALLHAELGYDYVPHDVLPTHPVLTDTHQLRAMVCPGHIGSVELHRALVPDEHKAQFPVESVLSRVQRTERGLRLDPVDMVRHVAVHARVSDWTRRTAELALRSVLDVGYLLKRHPGIVTELVRADDPVTVRRAVEAQLAAVADVFELRLDVPWRARLWWRWTLFVSSGSRRAWLWRHAALLPLYLRRDRMEARAGRRLRGAERVRYSASATLARLREAFGHRPVRPRR